MWRQWPQIWPKMIRKSSKTPYNLIKWWFSPQISSLYVFWGEKSDGDVRITKFYNLDPFSDVPDRKYGPKWSKIHQKHLTTWWNDRFFLKFGLDMFLGAGKPMVVSEIQNFKILTPFVTTLTPNMAQSGRKNIKKTQ